MSTSDKKAHFNLFLRQKKVRPTEARKIVRAAAIHMTGEIGERTITDYTAYVEGEEKPFDYTVADPVIFPGSVRFYSAERFEADGLAKLRDEDIARRMPGHQSYQPTNSVTYATLTVGIGSTYFLSELLMIRFQEIRELRERLVEGLRRLCKASTLGEERNSLLHLWFEDDKLHHNLYNARYLRDIVIGVERVQRVIDPADVESYISSLERKGDV